MASGSEFDGVFIGGGHQSLVCAAYMAKAGLDVAVLERSHTVGGGLSTIDTSGLGFRFNLHSINHFHVPHTPWYSDLDLESAGVEYIRPENEFAQPHSDGTGIVLSRDRERTVDIISEFSEADADQYDRQSRVAEQLTGHIYLAERYDEPLPPDERRDLLESTELGREFLRWTTTSAFDLVDEWYESERLKTLFLFKLAIFGEPGEGVDNPSHKGGITRCFNGKHTYQIARGGSQMLALGLQQVIQQHGGSVFTNCEVASIDVEDGRAVAVTLADGTSFGARQFVASGVDAHQTYDRFVGRDRLPESMASKLDSFEYTEWSLMGTHFALEEAPDYEAAEAVPEMNNALKYNLGMESLEDIRGAHDAVVDKSMPEETAFGGGALTTFDHTQAPDGKHTAYAWQVAPYDIHGDPENWRTEAERCRDNVLEKWSEYAPNMTEENVVHSYTYSPHQIARSVPNMVQGDIFMGAFHEDQTLHNHIGYRSPIEGLFLCGSATHPGGAINGAPGYIAAKVIHEELGMEPWWDPVDAREQLANLDDVEVAASV